MSNQARIKVSVESKGFPRADSIFLEGISGCDEGKLEFSQRPIYMLLVWGCFTYACFAVRSTLTRRGCAACAFQSSPTSTSFYPNRQTRQNDRAAREVQLIRNHHLKAHWDLLGHWSAIMGNRSKHRKVAAQRRNTGSNSNHHDRKLAAQRRNIGINSNHHES